VGSEELPATTLCSSRVLSAACALVREALRRITMLTAYPTTTPTLSALLATVSTPTAPPLTTLLSVGHVKTLSSHRRVTRALELLAVPRPTQHVVGSEDLQATTLCSSRVRLASLA
jgi:hypothetical protein